MVAGQVWRASGRGRGSGSGRQRPEPEGGAADSESSPETGAVGSEGRDRPEALEVVEDDDGDQGKSWWNQGWRTTPASWSNDSGWHEWYRNDGWNPQHGGTVLWLESKKPHGAEMEDGKVVPLMAIAMTPGVALTAVKIRAELGNRRRR